METILRSFLFLCVAVSFLIPNTQCQAANLEKVSVCDLQFDSACLDDRNYLIEFAIESNSIYQTCTASEDVVRMVFDIPETVFAQGVVEVLKLDGDIVGFYTLKVNENDPQEFDHELGHLFVKAGLQGRGYGTALFTRVKSVAKSKGWEKLEWLSDPDAKMFYLKMGGTIKSYCENLLNPGVDLPIFEYNLK